MPSVTMINVHSVVAHEVPERIPLSLSYIIFGDPVGRAKLDEIIALLQCWLITSPETTITAQCAIEPTTQSLKFVNRLKISKFDFFEMQLFHTDNLARNVAIRAEAFNSKLRLDGKKQQRSFSMTIYITILDSDNERAVFAITPSRRYNVKQNLIINYK